MGNSKEVNLRVLYNLMILLIRTIVKMVFLTLSLCLFGLTYGISLKYFGGDWFFCLVFMILPPIIVTVYCKVKYVDLDEYHGITCVGLGLWFLTLMFVSVYAELDWLQYRR